MSVFSCEIGQKQGFSFIFNLFWTNMLDFYVFLGGNRWICGFIWLI